MRKHFDQRHAKGPNVTRSGDLCSACLGRVVGVSRTVARARFSEGENCVDREFELVADGHNVGRFDVRVREALAVDTAKCVEKRPEHFASFIRREWTIMQNSPEVFLSILHHHENQIHARKLAASTR